MCHLLYGIIDSCLRSAPGVLSGGPGGTTHEDEAEKKESGGITLVCVQQFDLSSEKDAECGSEYGQSAYCC